MSVNVLAGPGRLPAAWHGLALGGGFGGYFIRLIIYRVLWRAGLAIWRVPVFGPMIDVVLGLVVIALIVLRAQRGPRWWQRQGGSGGAGGSSYSSDSDAGGPPSRNGPRDW